MLNLRIALAPSFFILFVATVLGGCATTTQPIPDLSQPESSGVGIDVVLRMPIGIFSNKPGVVYFAKIDSESGLLQQQFVKSNYVKDGRVYLLNARPGIYVAVAAFYLDAPVVPYGPPTRFTTYFSRELAEQTRVTVREGEFVFMGSYVVDRSVGFAEADEVQSHYANVIAPGATAGGVFNVLRGDYHYRGALIERRNDEQSRDEFFRQAKEDLAGSPWVGRLR